ncbi:hypothetical protein NSK_002355 [Nannochloropsis salina CCMP1776]|uniref:U-box domain-containing protein n=1 Tax=Nannochloropsis salina CCMP1776 TaxID=1027361 RepID=A0A4D9D6Z4_9STRA|nr:hypothetical protein NSK_002355 [Nannochloropsis salina CCMP1776]|eukprot:TFJ86147.1 hypothetical protein NSK_002355 [Nannochloropsis salina CCMP1776]
MSNISSCSTWAAEGEVAAHGGDISREAGIRPTDSINTISGPTITHYQPQSLRCRRKSFAESLYRALLRLDPARKPRIQAVFRYFKNHKDLSQDQVHHSLIAALGVHIVRKAWTEARADIHERPVVEPGVNNHTLENKSSLVAAAPPSEDPPVEMGTVPAPPTSPQRQYEKSYTYHPGEERKEARDRKEKVLKFRFRHGLGNEDGQLAHPPFNACITSMEDDVQLNVEDALAEMAPHAFVCPISLELMTRAVVAGDGFAYQQEALDEWILQKRREHSPLHSPMTNAPMAPFYIPSFTLRSLIGDYVEKVRTKRSRVD